MESNEQIIEKIKKLLRMKRGGSAAEVETALSLAQQLAAKYGIDINSVDVDDESKWEPITHISGKSGSRLQFENHLAAIICREFFNVKTFIQKYYNFNRVRVDYRVVFVGTNTDILIAEYVYNFLVKHFRREWNTKRGRLRNRKSFLQGMYIGLHQKLKSQQPQQPGIILSGKKERIQQYTNINFGKMETEEIKPDSRADAALDRGYIAGKNTNILKAVNGNEQQKLLEG